MSYYFRSGKAIRYKPFILTVVWIWSLIQRKSRRFHVARKRLGGGGGAGLYRTIKHKLLLTEEVLVRMQRRWTDIKRPPYKLEKASASLVGPLGVSWKTRLYRCLYNTPALQHQKSLLFLNAVLSFLEDFLNISSCICNLCFKPQRCSIRTFTSRVYFSFKRHSVSCLAAETEKGGGD